MVMVTCYNASNIVISLDNGIYIEIHFVNIMTLFLLTKHNNKLNISSYHFN